LLRRQHFGQQRSELHLAPHAARLHVRQHTLQVADARRQRLHLTQTPVHLLQPVGHDLERFAEALLERRLEFLVDRRPHLLEFGRIVDAQCIQPLFDRDAHCVQALLVRQRELGQLFAETLKLPLLQSGHVGQLLLGRFAKLADCAAHFVAQSRGRVGLLCTRVGEVLPDVRFHVRDLCAQGIDPRARFGRITGCVVARPAQRGKARQPDDSQHKEYDHCHEKDDWNRFCHCSRQSTGSGPA
jgi:hypothetical protein